MSEETIAIEKILANIDNAKRAEQIENLLGTVAYCELQCYEGDVEPYDVNSVDIVGVVANLVTLSDDEMENEIKLLLEQTIQDNVNRENISWTKDFVETYVKKYTPEYESSAIVYNSLKVEGPSSNLRDNGQRPPANAIYTSKNVMGSTLFSFKCRTDFSYDGTNVLSMYPSTEGSAPGTGYDYMGINYTYEGFPFGDHSLGLISKEGTFSWIAQGGAKAYYYPRLETSVYADGTWYGESYLN